jgi:Lon protease-like protein
VAALEQSSAPPTDRTLSPLVVSELGLFPLGLVLLPGERMPLHIFEPRYRELIGECLAEERPFGIVLADDSGLREIGTEASVIEVLERFDDGRLNVVIEGRERFRVVEMTSGRSFQTGEVEGVADQDVDVDEQDAERAMELFRELRELVGSDVEEPESGDPVLSFALASRVDFGLDPKQRLLELTSETERLTIVIELLEGALTAVREEQARRELASRNGKLRPT